MIMKVIGFCFSLGSLAGEFQIFYILLSGGDLPELNAKLRKATVLGGLANLQTIDELVFFEFIKRGHKLQQGIFWYEN